MSLLLVMNLNRPDLCNTYIYRYTHLYVTQHSIDRIDQKLEIVNKEKEKERQKEKRYYKIQDYNKFHTTTKTI